MAFKPYLQLVRLPNVFTAAADGLAGWLLAVGTFAAPGRWAPLVGASMALYTSGIVLNDVFDYDIDKSERPSRPLPSGRVSRRFAARLGWSLLGLGLGLAALSGSWASLAVAAALAVCVVAYDAGGKRTVLGPELMGACRGLNLLLGMSQGDRLGGPGGWLAATALAVFVAGVTWISRSETSTGRIQGVLAGMALQALGVAGLVVAATHQRDADPIGLFVLAGVGALAVRAGGRAVQDPVPATIQRAVKTGVLALVWLDVGLVAAARGPTPALAVAACWVPAFVLGRWLYST
ncbi:MAG TPA: UbiA family prenyltransferase [Isosphaeraceae bacterium]|jgi:4-hydroxybenzoate polyprenyltransferase|nr:UbiA family prenyltransferase [Isosphaeraceae bacterium]